MVVEGVFNTGSAFLPRVFFLLYQGKYFINDIKHT